MSRWCSNFPDHKCLPFPLVGLLESDPNDPMIRSKLHFVDKSFKFLLIFFVSLATRQENYKVGFFVLYNSLHLGFY